ncbi:MAG: SulP family inorganic anion transporter [Schleiferiaceae bacterium]
MKNYVPKDGLAGLKAHASNDLVSGFLVFLIALPLCLGISMASGFPPFAGIITAMVGGLLVSPIMGSRLSIKGPAAGLISIAVAAVAELGNGDMAAGYRYALAVVAITGVVQVGFALLKLGRYVDFFPTSAVHGMLAAIGIIIIAKQLPVLLGATPEAKSPIGLLLELPQLIQRADSHDAMVGLASLALLFGYAWLPFKTFKSAVPPQVVVLVLGIGLGAYFVLDPKFLVHLPASFSAGFVAPDFGLIGSAATWKYVVMFALVGSLESLLTVKAVDGLDPYRRKSDANRDLLAVGVGNSVAGLLGGLPMIAEVVRSSANVSNGAKTRWSNFYHGLALLLFVALLPGLLQMIPLSALAAMLIFTGYRLANPKLFRSTFQIGWDQLTVFLVTIVLTLAEDLLVGIFAGIVVELLLQVFSLKGKFGTVTKAKVHTKQGEDVAHVELEGAFSFANIIRLGKMLEPLKTALKAVVDARKVKMLDHSTMELLHSVQHDAEKSNRHVEVLYPDDVKVLGKHELSTRIVKKK